MRTIRINILVLGVFIGLAGCATPLFSHRVEATPGPYKPLAVFQVDESECSTYAGRQVASGIEAENNREAASVAIGAGLGAGLSGITRHDAPAGGTIAGGAPEPTIRADVTYQRDVSLQRTYDLAYAQCMQAKGNQVPGSAQLKRVPPPY